MIQVLAELARICWIFRNRRWYAHPPFLPLPPQKYIRWRLETAYGETTFRNVRWRDLVSYARWHRAMRLQRPSPVIKNDIWD